MRTVAAYIYFVTKDALLNLGASGTTLFGFLWLTLDRLGMPHNARIMVVAMYLAPLFLALFLLRGAAARELWVYVRTSYLLRSKHPRVLALSPRFTNARIHNAFIRAIDDYEQSKFYGAFRMFAKKRRFR